MCVAIGGIRQHLVDRDFDRLFIEDLGWDRVSTPPFTVSADGTDYELHPIAQKRGAVVCVADALPDRTQRARIERAVAKLHFEHVIVFTDSATGEQVWQWAKRDPGRPVALREQRLSSGQSGESLAERLAGLTVSLDEEPTITLTAVTARMRGTFDVDHITRAFYDRFKEEHGRFLGFITGMEGTADRQWYASLMLNRLMFTYFIQKRGFLDGDIDYLRNRLRAMQRSVGQGQFLSFYRYFLLRLFHEGFGQQSPDRGAALDQLLGRIPYLNGGLFEAHELEMQYPQIEIPDEAFEHVFDFFDRYTWHLDQRPLHNDFEINPDVLGYIFEKYINQRQMGAYYSKEDITGYISHATIIPAIFAKAEGQCAIAFQPESVIWSLLRDDPDRYIPVALLHGVDETLPTDVEGGLRDTTRRARWNEPATAAYGLECETWREHVGRRDLVARLRSTMTAGDVTSIQEVLTLNLDARQLAQDAIDTCEGPELLRAFYAAISDLTVLDPACGSGAFLFAALTILEPLYEACLERMRSFVDDPSTTHPHATAEFTDVLASVSNHSSRSYFIAKSIIVRNLHGVDIMNEAVEICKLRLFLKLVAQVAELDELEPLPDIDFSIHAGNSLVGYATLAQLQMSIGSQLDFDTTRERVIDRAESVRAAFQEFRSLQMERGGPSARLVDAKARLREQLGVLEAELDHYVARDCGVDTEVGDSYRAWRETHAPFHWFVAFYEVIEGRGGFDVIIGNPPYVEVGQVAPQYTVRGYRTLPCGDLYALFMERSMDLLHRHAHLGMITPVSLLSTDGFNSLRALLLTGSAHTWYQAFAERPSKLFTGVEKRLAIWIAEKAQVDEPAIYSGAYHRWLRDERPVLFDRLTYTGGSQAPRMLVGTSLPKISSRMEHEILEQVASKRPLATYLSRYGGSVVYYTRKLRYFAQFFDFVPSIHDNKGHKIPPSELKELRFESVEVRDLALTLLNSTLFFWFFTLYSDMRNLNRREILAFPCSLDELAMSAGDVLAPLATRLMDDFQAHSRELTSNYVKYGALTIQSFQPRLSKPIIDEIDNAVSDHYRLSHAQRDFITNFDIKYRVGAAEESGDAPSG